MTQHLAHGLAFRGRATFTHAVFNFDNRGACEGIAGVWKAAVDAVHHCQDIQALLRSKILILLYRSLDIYSTF